jgi:hypothetical protein
MTEMTKKGHNKGSLLEKCMSRLAWSADGNQVHRNTIW